MEPPNRPASFLIEGCDLVLPDRVIRHGSLLASGGTIAFVGASDKMSQAPASCRRISGEGMLACPAFWELHIHGAGGIGTESLGVKPLAEMAAFLARQGVGAFLPTTVAEERSLEDLGGALETVSHRPDLRGRIPGIYVEGPFVAASHRGGIPEGTLRAPSVELLDRLIGLSRGKIRMMTFAPELPGARALVARMQKAGILPAVGHSAAPFDALRDFEDVAPLNVTHLWNGMSGVSHKAPGLAQWALLSREAFTELNCDGTHVNDAAVRLTLHARPWERIIAISDAIAPAGLAEGEGASPPTLYGRPLAARGSGLYYAESGVLVGSRFLVRDCVARMVGSLKVPLAQAVAMATLSPARLLGFSRKGALLPGYDADVALFSRDLSSCSFLSWEGTPLHG